MAIWRGIAMLLQLRVLTFETKNSATKTSRTWANYKYRQATLTILHTEIAWTLKNDSYMSTSRPLKPYNSIRLQTKRRGISLWTKEVNSNRATRVVLLTEALEELAMWLAASSGYFLILAVKCYQLAVSVLQTKARNWTHSYMGWGKVLRNRLKVL